MKKAILNRCVGAWASLGGIALAAVALSGCEDRDALPLQIVGVNRAGASEVLPVSGKLLLRGMNTALKRVDQSTLSLIDESQADSSYELTRVTVGLQVEAEAGVEGVLDGAVEGALELRYEPLPTGL